jgi:hypothetical protein
MSNITVISRTQQIVVNPSSNAISVVYAASLGLATTVTMDDAVNNLFEVKGLPSGGKAGQVLVKLSDVDYDVGWVNS